MKRFLQALLGTLFVLCIFAGGVTFPGDSSAPPQHTAQETITARQVANKPVQGEQTYPITTETIQSTTEPHSVYFGGMTICEGQEFTGEITHYCTCAQCCCNITGNRANMREGKP